MQKLIIQGGVPLSGDVHISGAKNAALPILCASLLTSDTLSIDNVPHLNDVTTMLSLLRQLGVGIAMDGNGTRLTAAALSNVVAPYEMVKTMCASILVLGPMLARAGAARVSLPGGCAIGLRPVDQHIKGLQAMGAEIEIEHGYIHAKAKRLNGAHIVMDIVTVTGTENLMMAATLADGVTVLEDAIAGAVQGWNAFNRDNITADPLNFGLIARGETVIDRIYHLDRGYERIEDKLSRLGARIWRANEKVLK